ncbi:hypothetical protein F5Y09DRAFT_312431 [Xylaria sp. FL1042]|nr:hypothetical protein F5Y09DRAFT_312431 [Xylaria sp. FL1042]
MSKQNAEQPSKENGQYQGSQAFAHLLPAKNESVNPNTGSLNITQPIFELRGVRDSINFSLSLTYSAGSAGSFGLPKSWGLSLPYLIPGKSITTQGKTYAIDLSWTDVSGYQSGLKYINHHGMKFRLVNPPQRLPSGQGGLYAYQLQYPNGSIDFFDATGKPVEHHDIFGNFIRFSYLSNHHGDVLTPQPCLDYIADSWGQKIKFGYLASTRMDLMGPDETKVSVTYSERGVDMVTDASGYQTRYSYAPFDGHRNVLSEIRYPTSLISRFSYTKLQYLDTSRKARWVPAVQDQYKHGHDGKFLEHTSFRYGTETSGLTFTGAGKGFTMGGLRDSLMDGSDPYYKYDVTKMSLDENGSPLSMTSTFFNYLHLPIEELLCVPSTEDGRFRKTFRSAFTYEINRDQHARTTSYASPVSQEVTRNVSSTSDPSWKPMKRTVTSHDAFGNVLTAKEELCSVEGFWSKQKLLTNQYITTRAGITMLESETIKDEISGSVQVTHNVLRQDQKATESSTIHFSPDASTQLVALKKKEYEYDEHGRLDKETIEWSQAANAPEGSASNTTRTVAYNYADGILAESQTDAAGNVTRVEYDIRKRGGPLVRRTLPMGQSETFEYDSASRVVKHTDFLGRDTRTEYSVGNSNTVTTTSSLNYVTVEVLDPLGRTVEILDNGDPTQANPTATRVRQQNRFDGKGRVVQSTDQIGRVTQRSYDALDRPLKVMDPDTNVTAYEYDDINLTVRQAVNGDPRKSWQLDGALQPIKTISFADSGDNSIDYCIVLATVLDANKRVIIETLSEAPRDNPNDAPIKLLKEERKIYGIDNSLLFHSKTGWTEKGKDVVERRFYHDIFGNVHSYTKKTMYADGRTFTHPSPTRIYNSNNKLAKLCNQLGQVETYEYNENGWLNKTTKFDGSTITYCRDGFGQTLETEHSGGNKTFLSYLCKDRVSEIREGDQYIKYEYASDGTMTSQKFANGRTQTYKLDRFSRVVQEVDVFGVARETQYDAAGHVISMSCKGDQVFHTYGTANHTNGRLLSYHVQGTADYEVLKSYDGLGSTKQVKVQQGPLSKILLEATYSTNSMGQMLASKTISAVRPELSGERTWTYDGIGQLVQDDIKSPLSQSLTKFVYDGNSNVISINTDGTDTHMQYNAIDQRVDSGFEYDLNGHLKCDNRGRNYTYDAKDRLLSVRVSEDSSARFGYQPNDLLSFTQDPGSESHIYHGDSHINAIEITREGAGEATSILSGVDGPIASYSSRGDNAYFVDDRGSTALLLQQEKVASLEYQAYGKQKASTPVPSHLSFGFTKAFTNQTSGLVYLRSRFYDPDNLSFLTMDTYDTEENRYAYCAGDPVNYFDPTGHNSVWKWVAAIGGIAISAVATVGATALLTSLIGAEVIAASTAAQFAVGGVAAGAGTVLGNTTQHGIEALATGARMDYSGWGALRDFAMAAAATVGVSILSAALLPSTNPGAIVRPGVGEVANHRQALLNGVGSAVGNGALTACVDAIQHPDRPLDIQRIALTVAVGIVIGRIRFGAAGQERPSLSSASNSPNGTRANTRSNSFEMYSTKYRRMSGDGDNV